MAYQNSLVNQTKACAVMFLHVLSVEANVASVGGFRSVECRTFNLLFIQKTMLPVCDVYFWPGK